MPLTKVWNDNDYVHREKFKGKEIVIQAHESIEMDFEEAVEFKGQFSPIIQGKEAARHYKRIRVEWPKEPVAKVDPLVCHADGSQAMTQAELMGKLVQFSGLLVKDEAAEKAAAAKRDADKSEVEILREKVARLEALMDAQPEKRGPGRPKKESA